MTECTRCTAETATGIYLCEADTSRLEEVISLIPEALKDAEDTIGRRDKVTTSNGGGGDSSSRAPINLEASERATHLTELVHSWSRMLLEYDEPDMRSVEPLVYLKMSTHVIIGNEWAGEMLDELEAALKSVRQSTDLPPDLVSLGRCGMVYEGHGECGGKIISHMVPGRKGPTVSQRARCRTCGAMHDGWQIREGKIAESWDRWFTITETAALTRGIEGAPSKRTLQRWAKEGQIDTQSRPGKDGESVTTIRPAQIIGIIRETSEANAT